KSILGSTTNWGHKRNENNVVGLTIPKELIKQWKKFARDLHCQCLEIYVADGRREKRVEGAYLEDGKGLSNWDFFHSNSRKNSG
ncbi:unnamed protein product, partial [Prunus brigantina]